MANIKSQEKRIITSAKANLANKSKKSRVATSTKKFNKAVESGNVELSEKLYKETVGYIDSARLDGVYHKNTASRKVSTLSKKLDTAKKPKA